MPNISSIVKNVRNIMRDEDPGISGDAQRLEQLGWMLFLKILDEKDQELELIREGYTSVIPEKFQWRNWATDPEGITGDELLLFINHPTDGLFIRLTNLQAPKTPQRARPTQDDVQPELFSNQALESESENVQAQERRVTENTAEGFDNSPPEPANEPIDFYRLFVNQLSLIAASPVNENELVEKTDLHKSQVKDWLKRALNDGFVKKLNRPVRYQHVKNKE